MLLLLIVKERVGGLAILWKEDVDFEVLNFSIHHIHDRISIVSNEGN